MRARNRPRDHRHEDDLFHRGGTSDALPSIDELIRGARRPRPSARRRGRTATDFEVRHPVLLAIRFLIYGAMLLLGLVLTVGCSVAAAGHYSDADALAHAPACAQGVDLTTSTADCVGTRWLMYNDGTYEDTSNSYAIDLDVPDTTDPYRYETAVFPASAEFSDAVGESGELDAEFWEGEVVAMTATSGEKIVTVVTDANPGVPAGTDVGYALLSNSLSLLALLLFGIARPVRRWLPQRDFFRRAPLTGIGLGMVGCFFTAIGLTLQPERVLLAGVLGTSLTAGAVALVWLLLYQQSRVDARRSFRP